MSEPVTIKRDLGISPADHRLVFSKYDPAHQAKLHKAIEANLPETLTDIPESVDKIVEMLKNEGLTLMADSRNFLFDAIWDFLPTSKKETQDEPDNPTG